MQSSKVKECRGESTSMLFLWCVANKQNSFYGSVKKKTPISVILLMHVCLGDDKNNNNNRRVFTLVLMDSSKVEYATAFPKITN